jgi:hypothetical protein
MRDISHLASSPRMPVREARPSNLAPKARQMTDALWNDAAALAVVSISLFGHQAIGAAVEPRG